MAKVKRKDLGADYRFVRLKCQYCDEPEEYHDNVSARIHLRLKHPREKSKMERVDGRG